MGFDKFGPLRQSIKDGNKLFASLPRPNQAKKQVLVRGPSPRPEKIAREPLYRAERRTRLRIGTPQQFDSLMAVQEYAEAVLARVQELYSRATWPLVVTAGPDRKATYQGGVMAVPIPVEQMVVLHELAHHLVGNQQGHGPVFLDAYLYLISAEMGDTVQQLLLNELPGRQS